MGAPVNCPGCGHQNRERARFCEECGGPLHTSCSRCRTELRPGAKFCDGCGTPTSGGQRPAPREYTPRHLVEKILHNKSALEGERKQVTVLFADLKGSMELAEELDPEQWHAILDRFFQILADGVHRFEGTINQYTGDGVMALFGAPIAHEDHAQRACYAALHLTRELRGYADELRRSQGLNFSVRMGLNSGEVVVGKIGDDLRMDYTAQGPTVGLAARMEERAEPGRTYLTANTAALVSGYFELEELGEFRIKGVAEPVPVFALQSVGTLRSRLDVSRARGFSKFVGRAGEMEALETAFERSAAGDGQVVGVVADAGVGKSRLCYEFAERVRARGVPVREGRCVSHGKMLPFLPILELLRAFFGIRDEDDDETARRKIAGTLVLIDPQLESSLPLMFDFLGVPDPQRPVPPLEPEVRQDRLFSMLRRVTQARGAQAPAVILVEDLHWIDGGSEAFLQNTVNAVAGSRIMVLVNFRPGYHSEWMQKSYYQQLPLHALGDEAIVELFDDLLGGDPSLGSLRNLIRKRTGGNPFFIEEVVKSLTESGSLEGERGAYRLTKPIEELVIPATVQALLSARIDRSPEREKQLLQTAAVIGKTFGDAVLARTCDFAAEERDDVLRNLVASEFLYVETLYPETEYTFKHPLTQEVAYRSQLADRRARIHATVAKAILELCADDLDEQAALLAHHWGRAGDARAAARWHARAAEWAGDNHPDEALGHWRNVIRYLDPDRVSLEEAPLALQALSQVLWQGGRRGLPEDEIDALLRQGRALAERSHNPNAIVPVVTLAAIANVFTGKLRDAAILGDEAVRLADETGVPLLRTVARLANAQAKTLLGRPEEALARFDEAGELIDEPDANPGATPLGFTGTTAAARYGSFSIRGLVLAFLGRIQNARASLDRGIELARRENAQAWLSSCHVAYVTLASCIGDPELALLHGRRAVETAVKTSIAGYTSALTALGRALAMNELWEEARAALEEAHETGGKHGATMALGVMILADLGRVHLALGNPERARELAHEGVAFACERGAQGMEAIARLSLVEVLMDSVPFEETRAEIEANLATVENLRQQTKIRAFYPQLLELRARAAAPAGDEEGRRRWLAEARRVYSEIGATGHLARLEGETGTEQEERA